MKDGPGWNKRQSLEIKTIFSFCEGYKRFLDASKTERETIQSIEDFLRVAGFELDFGSKRVFMTNKGKSAIALVKGSAPLADGLNIIVAHVDAPRLDLKQRPIFEDVDLVLLRTHYYGGIKKYQWVTMPLAIHGVIIKSDGRRIELAIGEAEDDPVFVIDDLLPHLSRKIQDEKRLSEAIEAEKLTILFGSIPLVGIEKEAIKCGILKILNDRYGVVEEDFISAELEVVVPLLPSVQTNSPFFDVKVSFKLTS